MFLCLIRTSHILQHFLPHCRVCGMFLCLIRTSHILQHLACLSHWKFSHSAAFATACCPIGFSRLLGVTRSCLVWLKGCCNLRGICLYEWYTKLHSCLIHTWNFVPDFSLWWAPHWPVCRCYAGHQTECGKCSAGSDWVLLLHSRWWVLCLVCAGKNQPFCPVLK